MEPVSSLLELSGDPMLVISRKVGESLVIGDDIAVTVVKIAGGGVRLGIEAPEGLLIVREELQDEYRDVLPSRSREAKPSKSRLDT